MGNVVYAVLALLVMALFAIVVIRTDPNRSRRQPSHNSVSRLSDS